MKVGAISNTGAQFYNTFWGETHKWNLTQFGNRDEGHAYNRNHHGVYV